MNKKKTCMVFIGKYPHDVRVRREAEALIDAGFEVSAICLKYPDQPSEEIIHGVKVYRLKIRRQRESKIGYIKTYFLFTIFAFWKVFALHLREKFSVIHVHNVPDILVIAALGAKIAGAKIVFDMHEIMPEFFQRKYGVKEDGFVVKMLKVQEKLMTLFADRVVVATPFLKNIVENRSTFSEKVSVLLNLADPKYFQGKRAKIRKKAIPFKLIYAGTYSKIHGVDLAIYALKNLASKTNFSIELFLYGTGDEEKNLRQLIKKLGLENSVFLMQEVPIDEIGEILSQMDCGLIPKRDGVFIGEAISTKMFDYAAVGLPTICSKTKGDSLFFDDSMVKFFEPENIEDLAKAIRELMENYQLRVSLSKNISGLFAKINWTTEKKKLLKIYEQLTEKD